MLAGAWRMNRTPARMRSMSRERAFGGRRLAHGTFRICKVDRRAPHSQEAPPYLARYNISLCRAETGTIAAHHNFYAGDAGNGGVGRAHRCAPMTARGDAYRLRFVACGGSLWIISFHVRTSSTLPVGSSRSCTREYDRTCKDYWLEKRIS